MKIKDNLLLKKLGNEFVVVPVGQGIVDFKVMITLNESGALLWNKLKDGADFDELIRSLMEEYDVSPEEARKDIEEFIKVLDSNSLIYYEEML